MKSYNVLGFIALVVLCAVLIVPAAGAATTRQSIRVTNLASGETVRFPVVLIRGELADAKLNAISVTNGSSKWSGLAGEGRFKVLVELAPGANKLVIAAGGAKANLSLNYKPQTNSYVVRVHYFVDKSGDTRFQTPLKNDPQNWRGKLDTAMKLMQTFTAQRIGDLGLGRRTFNLELDDRGRVKVHILKGRRDAAHYRKLTGGQLYAEAAGEIKRQFPHKRAKNLVIPAFTRFDAKTGKVGAHTALGGGNLALFGGGDLFTWPDSIAGVQAAFMNATRVDPKTIFSDSVGRHTFWANASTTMGAALHELGHTFSLPHSRDVHDIMTRGHDRLNRFFTLVEPPHAGQKEARGFKDSEIACWSAVSGGALGPNRFFALDDRAWKGARKIVVRVDPATGLVVFESPYGLRYIGLWRVTPGGQTQSIAPALIAKREKMPRKVTIPLAELKKQLGDMKIKFRVIDDEGLGSTTMLSSLLKQTGKASTSKPGK
ncbi:MAG: metallopeptidase [Phycisphaerae bacterium]|nr:metallopeptidase [Phycisphaerae bacterium]